MAGRPREIDYVAIINAKLTTRKTHREIAKDFGISASMVSVILGDKDRFFNRAKDDFSYIVHDFKLSTYKDNTKKPREFTLTVFTEGSFKSDSFKGTTYAGCVELMERDGVWFDPNRVLPRGLYNR